ncbi:hypothetical protein M9H77_07375 [Catharanthus roseus]|uniref:Uncharacterized protein n=1 Tax=Catharanthus roseus TaxID=4058 RepID=A0ACC0BUX3_CATRO|nr:hypothetical protein M9H77_07375 [Catharanthus roseus]
MDDYEEFVEENIHFEVRKIQINFFRHWGSDCRTGDPDVRCSPNQAVHLRDGRQNRLGPDRRPGQPEHRNDVDPNTFEEFLEPEECVDHGHLFTTDRIFNSKPNLVNWARNNYESEHCGGANEPGTKPVVDNEEEEVQIKRWGPYETKKCGYPFKLKGEQMAMCENWQVFIHDGRYNHAIAKVTEEQLIHIEQFRKSHVPPRNILRFFLEQNVGCAVSAQKIYNVVAKIKKNRMQGRNTVEEFLCLSTKRDYTAFYRNWKHNNVLSDIVVAHPTSIEIIRTWPYIKHLYFSNAMSTKNQEDVCDHEPKNGLAKLNELTKDKEVASQFVNGSWKKLLDEIDEQEYLRKLDALKTKWKSRSNFLHYLFNNRLNLFAHKFVRCWIKSHMNFRVETTNRTESEYSVLKLWLSTCHGDLDTVFLNTDSLIEGQIADIKASLEFSRTKENHLALKKIWSETPRADGIYDDPKNKCRRYLRMSHCLLTWFVHTLEIGSHHPLARQQDKDSEMLALTKLLHQISIGPISKVREMCHLVKGVLSPVLPEDPSVTLTSPPEVAITKGQKKTNSTKRDKSHWEHSSGFCSGSGSGSGSWSGSDSGSRSRGRGRLPRAPRGRGRGRDRGWSSLSSVIHASPSSTFPYTNTFPAFIYPFISNWKNVIGDRNCGYRVVADFVFSDEHQWPEVCRRMLYELEHSMNVYRNLVGSTERVNRLIHRIRWQDGPALYRCMMGV